MYHGGGERGWHRGHPPRDIPAPRNHRSRPYRGGYREHRDHDSYGSYHDNQCHDRSQFVEYSDNSYPEYYEENQSFNEYREPRESAYKRGGRHDSGYHKETYYRGSYQRGRGEPARYWGSTPEPPNKKYSHKSVKAHKKESENRAKTSTIIPAEKVIHNSGRTIVILTPGITEDESETKSSKTKSPERDAKPLDCEKPSQETAKLESIKTEDVIVESVVKEILTPPSGHRNETLPACNVEITETKKEDSLQLEQSTKEEVLPVRANPGKRAHSEEKDADVGQREGESFAGKRLCNNQDRDEDNLEKTVQIPLLGCWGDNIPSESVESAAASKSEQENTESAVICQLPDTAQELRTAFILAKKEQIEVAFAQDCKTFAFVANTLLKKDPSIEATVTSALRSTLQEMAGLCVQELNNFIDHYDSGV